MSNTLKDFGLDANKVYAFNTLKEEWRKYCKFGFAMGIMIWRVKFVDKENMPDIVDYQEGDELKPLKIAADKEDEYRQIIRDLVLHMNNNNYF